MRPWPQSTSLYCAAANAESLWAVRIVFMIAVALACTFASVGPMLPVVSARKMMSGFGGMIGVWTVLVIVTLSPGLSEFVYVGGSTPGVTACAAPAANPSVTSATAKTTLGRLRRKPRMLSPPSLLRDEA